MLGRLGGSVKGGGLEERFQVASQGVSSEGATYDPYSEGIRAATHWRAKIEYRLIYDSTGYIGRALYKLVAVGASNITNMMKQIIERYST